jgi:hypothetical protein
MFNWGKVMCVFCDRRVPKTAVIPLRDWKDMAICKASFASREQTGRKCGQCGSVVNGRQEVSAFEKPMRTFGHADCGGMRLAG